MTSNQSEIFDNFAALALKQGLISEAKDDPRRGSDDISTIEALYGVKPNGKDDEKSIVEQAHPDMCVISPAYDHLNSIIENVIERQNIMVGIVNKPPQAKLTQHRYASAHQDLTNELLKIGFVMDSKDEDNLRILADSCAENITKISMGPLLPVIGLIGGALGLIAAYNHFGAVDQGVRANCEGTVRELNDMLEDQKYTAVHAAVSKMVRNITFVKTLADKIAAKAAVTPRTSINHAVAASESPEYKSMEKLLDTYQTACQMLAQKVPAYIELLTSVSQDSNKEYEAGWLASLKSVVRTVWTSDATDAVNYLTTLQKSLSKSSSEISSIRQQYEKYVEVNHEDILSMLSVESPSKEKGGDAPEKEEDDIEKELNPVKKQPVSV